MECGTSNDVMQAIGFLADKLGTTAEKLYGVLVGHARDNQRRGVNSVTVTIHLKSGVKQTYLETVVMDDVEARLCVLASGVMTGNRRDLQGRKRNHYGFFEDSHIAYNWKDIDRVEITR